jgi:hypothetical protein
MVIVSLVGVIRALLVSFNTPAKWVGVVKMVFLSVSSI